MKKRDEAEARAMELFPIDDFPFREDAERQEELRKAFLQCWDEMQANKQTCGFCVEPKKSKQEDVKELSFDKGLKILESAGYVISKKSQLQNKKEEAECACGDVLPNDARTVINHGWELRGDDFICGNCIASESKNQEKVDECEHEWVERCIQGCEYIECLECGKIFYK